jgi:hypothetical protein
VPAFYVVIGAMMLLYSTVIHIPNMKAKDRTAKECVFEVLTNRLGICTNVVCHTFKGFFNCVFWNKGKNRYHFDVEIELFFFNVLVLKTICLDFTVPTLCYMATKAWMVNIW